MRVLNYGFVWLLAATGLSLVSVRSLAQQPQPNKSNDLRAALLAEIKAHDTHAFNAMFSPDGKILATAGDSPHLQLWDGVTGKPRPVINRQLRAPVRCLAMAPDGKLLASGDILGQLCLWEMPRGVEFLARQAHQHAVTSLAFSPDGKLLASASLDKNIHLWDPIKGKIVDTIKSDAIDSLAFSPDGKLLAAGTADGPVQIWELAPWRLKHTLPGQFAQIFAVAFSPDGKTLVSADSSRLSMIRFWDPTTGREKHRMPAHQDPAGDASIKSCELPPPRGGVRSVAFSPDGLLLVSAGQDAAVVLWEVATARMICRLDGHDGGAPHARFSPAGDRLVTATFDGKARLWDVQKLFSRGRQPAPRLSAAELDKLWLSLLDPDPATGYAAIAALRAAPPDSLPFLKTRFLPMPAADAGQLARWVEDLDSPLFRTREKAIPELTLRGEAALPALRTALQRNPSLEMRRRIEKLLAQLEPGGMVPERLRLLRTIQALDGNADARPLLERFANGNAGDLLTQQAQRSLARLK